MTTARNVIVWWGAASVIFVGALALVGWYGKRRQARVLEGYERARVERHNRYLAAQLIMQINAERRRQAASLEPQWYVQAKAIQAFRDQLASLPDGQSRHE